MLATAVQAANVNICDNVANKIFLQDVTNCTKYYLCLNGQAQSRYCDNGMYFNAEAQACTDSQANCLQCQKGNLTMVPLSKTCNKYVLCFDGTPIVQACNDGLQFNPKIGKCDLAKNVACVDNQCSVYDDTPSSIKYIPSAVTCGDYYICMNGQAQPLSCATGLYFNPLLNGCDLADNVNCTIAKIKDFEAVAFEENTYFLDNLEGKQAHKKAFRENHNEFQVKH